MKVTYFGTTTLLFDDGKDQIFFDCHFTRPSLPKYIFGREETNTALADELFVMEEGKIILSGKPEEIYHSHNELIEAFKKSLSFEIK